MHNSYNHRNIYDVCEEHMHAYVLLEMKDGTQTDGIITGIDHENVYVAVPIGEEMAQSMRFSDEKERQFGYQHGGYGGYGSGYGGYPQSGYGGYGGYHGHHQSYGRPRRFNRLILPLAALTAVSLLPWY